MARIIDGNAMNMVGDWVCTGLAMTHRRSCVFISGGVMTPPYGSRDGKPVPYGHFFAERAVGAPAPTGSVISVRVVMHGSFCTLHFAFCIPFRPSSVKKPAF